MNNIEINLKAKAEMERIYKMNWRDLWMNSGINWLDLISCFRMNYGRCIDCAGNITALNLKFFDFDVKRIKCYKCQNR